MTCPAFLNSTAPIHLPRGRGPTAATVPALPAPQLTKTRVPLRADELNRWETSRAFDIVEPVFVLEMANQRHRFALSHATGEGVAAGEPNVFPDP